MTDGNPNDAWRRELRLVLKRSDASPEEQLARLEQIRTEFHEELAKAAESIFNNVLMSRDKENFESRRELCSWGNEQARQLGLVVRCPRTNLPAVLSADRRDHNDSVGRFRLDVTTDTGEKPRTLSTRLLPQLSLMPAAARREAFSRSYRDSRDRSR